MQSEGGLDSIWAHNADLRGNGFHVNARMLLVRIKFEPVGTKDYFG